MSTLFIGVSPSALLGHKQYYRIVFDLTRQVMFGTPWDKLSRIYDTMQDTGVIAPLSPNPVVSGDYVMVVDAWSLGGVEGITVAEAVRRLNMVAGGAYESVRSIQKLASIRDVENGANDRQAETVRINEQNAAADPLAKIGQLLGGLSNLATVAVVGLVAYAAILAFRRR